MTCTDIEGFLSGVRLQFSPPSQLSWNHPGPVPEDLVLTGGTVGGVAGPPPHVRKHSHSLPPDGDVFPPLVLEISRLDIFLLVEAEVPVVPLQPLLLG